MLIYYHSWLFRMLLKLWNFFTLIYIWVPTYVNKSTLRSLTSIFPELGTRQLCDNTATTTWPCFQAKKMVDIVLWLHSVWLLHLQIPRPKKNYGPWCSIYVVALLRCRCREAKNCREPNSACYCIPCKNAVSTLSYSM